jgi:DNA repair photolyase
MPVLPFLEDDLESIHQIVFQAHQTGVGYIIPSFGMSLRDRQREYYYQKLDRFFPGLSQQYQRAYGDQYRAAVRNSNLLEMKFKDWCREFGIATRMPRYSRPQDRQMHLFTEHSNHSTVAS